MLIRLSVRTRPRFRGPLCERHWCRSTPGVLGSGPSSVVSVHRRLLRPHPPVSQARGDFTALPLIRRAFAVRERRGDPRDLPYFPCRPVHACRRPYAGGFAMAFPLCAHRDARLPRAMSESPPTVPVSASNARRGNGFRRCIVRFMLRPAYLPGPPGWLRRDAITCSAPRLLRLRVTPAFDGARHQAPLGVRLKGRTGNLPSSGLSPNQFTAGSEAAP